MGHRALVAVETERGRYDVYHSQWGGSALTDPAVSVDAVVTEVVESTEPDATERSAAGVLDALDPIEYEALLVSNREGHVEAFLVVWLGLVAVEGRFPATGSDRLPVALVPVADPDRGRRVRRSVRRTKEALGGAVDAGDLEPAQAVVILRARVVNHPDVSGEVVWGPS